MVVPGQRRLSTPPHGGPIPVRPAILESSQKAERRLACAVSHDHFGAVVEPCQAAEIATNDRSRRVQLRLGVHDEWH